MVFTRRQSALAQLPTPAATSPVKTVDQLDDGCDELDGPLTDLEDEKQEEEDYDDDVEMLSDSASEDNSGSDWEEKGIFSRLDIELQQ